MDRAVLFLLTIYAAGARRLQIFFDSQVGMICRAIALMAMK
jgi:hypothetical protein